MNRLALAGLLLGVFGVGSALAASPLSADLAWRQAHGVGDIRFEGASSLLYVPMDPRGPPPDSTLFALEAREVLVALDYRNYRGSPAGLVGTDTEARHEERLLAEPRLVLDAARGEVQVLAAAPERSTFDMAGAVGGVDLRPQAGLVMDFFSGEIPSLPPPELQRHYDQAGPFVRLASAAWAEPVLLNGTFTLHLWDLDVRDETDGALYRSGLYAWNQTLQTLQTPDGLAYEARRQLLTLQVTDGTLRLYVPERSAEAWVAPPGSRLLSEGAWDVSGATGRLAWNGADARLDDTQLQLGGGFETRFNVMDEGGVRATWTGEARRVAIASEPLRAGSQATAPDRGRFDLALLIGAVLVGAGGFGTLYGVRTYQARRSSPAALVAPMARGDYAGALRASERALEAGQGAGDALVTKCAALLKMGRAREVVEALGGRIDDREPLAPIQAYLLSLAHLSMGEREAGADWAVRAVRLFPDFVHELVANEAFESIRDHPKLREFLGGPGTEDVGYV